jgi:hypothetical protein
MPSPGKKSPSKAKKQTPEEVLAAFWAQIAERESSKIWNTMSRVSHNDLRQFLGKLQAYLEGDGPAAKKYQQCTMAGNIMEHWLNTADAFVGEFMEVVK